MSFIILPKNADKTAVLVEQNKDVVIDSSTPVEVNIQQPVDVSVNNFEDITDPLPVEIAKQTHETDSVIVLNEISRKLSVLIKYESMLHKVDLEEDL